MLLDANIQPCFLHFQQVHKLNDVCWDRCVDKPSSKLDSRQENCLSNCVDRFVDVSLVVTNRFAQLMQKQQGM